MAKLTPPKRERTYICDFRRCRLNVRLCARIQPLLPGHKYRFFLFLVAVLWRLEWNQKLGVKDLRIFQEIVPFSLLILMWVFWKVIYEEFCFLLSSSSNPPTHFVLIHLIQQKHSSQGIPYAIFVAWELRECNMIEKPDIKKYWFWRLCVLYNWVKINIF